MKTLSNDFIQALNNDEREYLAYATIQLMSGTSLYFTNEEIWMGGFHYEEAVSEDESFTSIGSAIMGSATLIINNVYETYSDYDFSNARVTLTLGIVGANDTLSIGEYRVDDTNYNGATIQLTLLDNMVEFDRPYSLSTLVYPTTLGRIVYDACLCCGIGAAPSAISFLNDDFIIRTKPTDETVTFRDIIAWAAAIAGCYAKINIAGELEFKWFNITALNAVDTDSPTFHPWDNGQLYNNQGVHFLYSLNSQNICTDDVVITGVTIHVKAEDNEEAESDIIAYSYTSSGLISGDIENDGSEYIILIENNQLIDYRDAATILLSIGPNLVGLRFRKLNITQVSDPSIEAGDVAIVTDRKFNHYKTLITRNVFSIGSSQNIVCGADTPSRSNALSNPSVTKSYIEARKLFKKGMSATEDALNSAILAAQAADAAQESADSAMASARSANNSANSALTQLSVVEDVAGTLNWIRENGVFTPTNDTTVVPGTVYFEYVRGDYIPIGNPDPNANPHENGWYVLDVTDSQSEYIMAHLAVTSAGLWVLPLGPLSPHVLKDSADYDLEDSDGNLLVDWSKDPQNADGYKVLLASDGMTIYDNTGTAVAHYGTTTTIGAEMGKHVYIDTNSVNIKDGENTLAKFDGSGVSVYDSNGEVAKFYNSDGQGRMFLRSSLYSNSKTEVSTSGTFVDLFGNDTTGQQYANEVNTNGVYKAKYTTEGVFYNNFGLPVGTYREMTDTGTPQIASSTWDIVGAITLDAGTWIVTFGGAYEDNSSGIRYFVLNTSLSYSVMATRQDIRIPAANGIQTSMVGTRIMKITADNTDVVLHVYQNSGTDLFFYPTLKAIKIL